MKNNIITEKHESDANAILDIIREKIKGSGCTVMGEWISNLGSTHDGNNDYHLFPVITGKYIIGRAMPFKGIHINNVFEVEKSAAILIEDLREQLVVPGLV